MTLIENCDDEVVSWASQHLKQTIFPPYRAFGIAENGEMIGAMVFNGWNGANMEITVYGPGAMTKSAISFAYDYIFNQAGAIRLTARTRRNNLLMRKLLPRLGFKYEGTMKKYFGPEKADDALLFVLWPENGRKLINGRF